MHLGPFPRALAETDDFLVTVELLTSPGDGVETYTEFFEAFQERYQPSPGRPRIVAVMSPQSPGGVATMDPFVVWSRAGVSLPERLDAIAHVTCKDQSRNGLETHLRNLRSVGVQTLLALTGDQPQHSRPVFELDSLGLLRLITEVNGQFIKSQDEEQLDGVFQFVSGAGFNPYKYTLGSSWQQYSKLVKKIMSGATFIITQLGYDMAKSAELIRYLAAHDLPAPCFGNVYFLNRQAVGKMHTGELPGCYVSDELMEHATNRWRRSWVKGYKAALRKMAYQTVMFRDQGYRGVHIGGVGMTYDDVIEIIDRSHELYEAGLDPEQVRLECHFPAPDAQYFIGDDGEVELPDKSPKPSTLQRALEFVHDHVADPESAVGKRLTPGADDEDTAGQGFAARALHRIEDASKSILVQCRDCGDCRLPENFYALCHEAACVKGLPNLPCGDSDAVTGNCGNDDDTICAGELVFYAAFARGKLGELANQVQESKVPELRGTSAVRNYLAGLDHQGRINGQLRGRSPFDIVMVGESIHAHVPRVYWGMDQVLSESKWAMSGPLAYLAEAITSQVVSGADYIAVNVDAFSGEVRARMMRYYVDLVNSLGQGIPACIDSADPEALAAGLDQYFRTARDPEALPIVNSITMMDPEPVLELREKYPFKVVAMLHERVDKTGVKQAVSNYAQALELAHEMFDMLAKAGFTPEDIFFDTVVTPISADIECTRTYHTMQGIRAISRDSTLQGARTIVGLSNCSHMMPNRLAVNRSYLYIAIEYGLGAAVLAPRTDYGLRMPGRQITTIIGDLAENDGSDPMKGFEIFESIAKYSRRYGRPRKGRAAYEALKEEMEL